MLSNNKRPVETKLLLLIFSGALLVLIGSMLVMFRVRQSNVELVGTTTAQTMADQLFSLRTFYSTQVVPRAREGGLELNHNWDSREATLPVPASLIKAVGADFEETHPGTIVRTYSRYPWPNRAATETYDEFEMAAITALELNPTEPFFEIVEYEGQTAVRYAVADVMGESCVACHNSHAESPKQDWAVGDVRGVLEILLPVEAAQSGITQGIGILGLIIASGLAMLAIAVWRVMRNLIFKPLNSLIETSESVDAGNLHARANVQNNDEIGYMAIKFNEMLDRTTQTLNESLDENARLQSEINVLLNEVTNVALGDLTVEVTQSDGITGQIGSSVDYMVSQLRTIISDVNQASLQVSESTTQIQSTATDLADAAESQAKQIITTSSAIDEMNASIQKVSENSALSASIGEQARFTAKKGAEAVDNTIDGMSKIREQVTQSAFHIKQLGERSAEIGNFLKTIGDISERTSILALNAAIQASVAGEAGSGFATANDYF